MFKQSLAPSVLPPGQRVYAVGDVHGCAGRLATLHAAIAADLAERPVAQPWLVHLGDYIDRGSDSAGVVARLMAGPPVPGLASVNLRGNHEQMMLDALAPEDDDQVADWLRNGGGETLRSWGIAAVVPPADWARLLPQSPLSWMAALPVSSRAGGYLFVHAGVRPGVPLDQQLAPDLLWMREPFLSSDAAFGAVVVHGHTPVPEPVVRPNRIGIDTGAVLGGRLTCVVLEANRMGFLQA